MSNEYVAYEYMQQERGPFGIVLSSIINRVYYHQKPIRYPFRISDLKYT